LAVRGAGATTSEAASQRVRPFGHCCQTLPAIAILALLTISGVAYTDLLLTSDRQAAQRAN
jgi:ABC-type proline/glycine betaine transport system permease subunit